MKTVTIQTFGYDYGALEGDYKFKADVRNVPGNGIDRKKTGMDKENAATIMARPQAKAWLKKMENTWTPKLEDGDKVAIGCAWGHHRSVAIAQAYAAFLRSKGWKVTIKNRDMMKTEAPKHELLSDVEARQNRLIELVASLD